MKLGLKASAKPLALETAAGAASGAYSVSGLSEVDVAAAKREEKAGAAEIGLGAVLTGGITAGLGGVAALGVGKLGTVGAERSIKLQQQAKESILKKNAEKLKAEGATSKELGDVHDPFKAVSYTHLTLPTIYSV